jgi:hypothetical protein
MGKKDSFRIVRFLDIYKSLDGINEYCCTQQPKPPRSKTKTTHIRYSGELSLNSATNRFSTAQLPKDTGQPPPSMARQDATHTHTYRPPPKRKESAKTTPLPTPQRLKTPPTTTGVLRIPTSASPTVPAFCLPVPMPNVHVM